MPIVRDLIQAVVIGKTPGHQAASLRAQGDIANNMASKAVLDLVERHFLAADKLLKLTCRINFVPDGAELTIVL